MMNSIQIIRSVLVLVLLSLVASGCSGSGSDSNSSASNASKVFAYAGSQYTSLMYSFELNKETGELTPTSTPSVATESLPMISANTYDKKFLVCANYSSNSLSSYAIDSLTGNLTWIEHTSTGGSSNPAWIVAHPSQSTFYVANAGAASIAIFDIDSSGHLTLRSSIAAGSGVTSLAISSDGSALYSADQGVDRVGIYSIGGDGNLTAMGTVSLAGGSQPNQVYLSKNRSVLYVANWGTGSVSAFSISGSTLTSLGADVNGGGGGVYTVSEAPDGQILYAAKPYANQYSTLPIDPSTGALGAATNVAFNGSVNFSFWHTFAYLVPWSNPGLPLQARLYDSSDGSIAGTSFWTSTDSYRGLYQLNLVEITQ